MRMTAAQTELSARGRSWLRMRAIGDGSRKRTPARAPTVAIHRVGRRPRAAPSTPPWDCMKAELQAVSVVWALELMPNVDLLIGAVLVPGAKAPKLIGRAMLRQMRPGSVLVDIAIDQGGCAETSRPTTHHNPVFVEEGVTHYCVANMPGAYARTATQALTNVTYRYIELLADYGLAEACEKQPALVSGVNIMNGNVTHRAIADAHGIRFAEPKF